jgi:hypothetical protein
MTLLGMASTVLGLLLVATLGLIAIPFHVTARAELDASEADAALDVWWCWGLLGIRLLPSAEAEISIAGRVVHRRSIERTGDVGKAESQRETQSQAKKSRSNTRVLIEHRETILHISKRVAAALEPDAAIWGHIGLSQPEQTALLDFILRELDSIVPGIEIDIGANYIEESILLEGVLRVFVWPARLVVVGIELVSQRDTRQLIQALR